MTHQQHISINMHNENTAHMLHLQNLPLVIQLNSFVIIGSFVPNHETILNAQQQYHPFPIVTILTSLQARLPPSIICPLHPYEFQPNALHSTLINCTEFKNFEFLSAQLNFLNYVIVRARNISHF